MIPPTLRHLFAATAALVLLEGSAFAQSACQRHRAELASLGRGGSRNDAAAAQRQRAEIARMSGYYQSIGCDRGSFLFFSPPAECGAIAARIRSMQATYAELAGRGSSDGNEARRAELRSMVARACRDEDVQRKAARETDEPRRVGGARMVCVRACDGFFFPLDNRPGGRTSEDQLCQALCPGAQAAAYRMPTDGEIKEAISLKGRPYVRLANASKFQKERDQTCSCKPEDKSWAQALQTAERMIGRGRGDMIVTAAKAEELSRPRLSRTAARQLKDLKRKPAERTEEFASQKIDPKTAQTVKQEVEAKTNAAATPTAEGDGPKTLAGQPIDVEATGSTKPKRTIRVVGPSITPIGRAKSQ
ncbi:MAG TPA: DUF2865 domain-containing protein [Beijerinckiaceae bacterium]|nr:DUF2865 domain-containing protein [Beijerinckiaceae bacterium]